MLYCVWLYVNCAKNICECEDALVTNKLSRRNTFHSPKVCCILPWMQLHKNPMYVINFMEKAVFTYFLSWQKLYNHGVCVIVYFAYSSHSIYFLSSFFPTLIWKQTYNTNFGSDWKSIVLTNNYLSSHIYKLLLDAVKISLIYAYMYHTKI